jgi:hypothetical protein
MCLCVCVSVRVLHCGIRVLDRRALRAADTSAAHSSPPVIWCPPAHVRFAAAYRERVEQKVAQHCFSETKQNFGCIDRGPFGRGSTA